MATNNKEPKYVELPVRSEMLKNMSVFEYKKDYYEHCLVCGAGITTRERISQSGMCKRCFKIYLEKLADERAAERKRQEDLALWKKDRSFLRNLGTILFYILLVIGGAILVYGIQAALAALSVIR